MWKWYIIQMYPLLPVGSPFNKCHSVEDWFVILIKPLMIHKRSFRLCSWNDSSYWLDAWKSIHGIWDFCNKVSRLFHAHFMELKFVELNCWIFIKETNEEKKWWFTMTIFCIPEFFTMCELWLNILWAFRELLQKDILLLQTRKWGCIHRGREKTKCFNNVGEYGSLETKEVNFKPVV